MAALRFYASNDFYYSCGDAQGKRFINWKLILDSRVW
jgi:hypothetical protein